LVHNRLGVEVLPEALARQVTEKAEGNPLFAEEIVSFLRERGLIREASALAAALPLSVQSQAYSLANEIHVSTLVAPKSRREFYVLKQEAIGAARDTADAYIQNWTRFVIGWEEFHQGRMTEAQNAAHELIRVGDDPRSVGLGLSLLTWIALVGDSLAEALAYSEQSLAVAVAPSDRFAAISGKACALVLLRQTKEGAALLEQQRRRCIADGDLYTLVGTDGIVGAGKVLEGHIADGIRFLEEAILKREKEDYQTVADWYRITLCEIYLQIIAGNGKLPIASLLRNLPILLKVTLIAPSRLHDLTTKVLENPHLDPAGHHVGHVHLILGLLYKAKKKRALAVQHLTEASRILMPFGESPMLARVETALAELGQQA
jgi:hypothetical protein